MRRLAPWIAALAWLGGCAQTPPAPSHGRGTLFGELRLLPHEGVTMPSAGDGSYGDPRLRDARLVDYSQPGFAVVYLEQGARPGERVEIAIRASQFETRLEPRWTALAQGGSVVLRNLTDEPHTVSVPSLSFVGRIAPGESLELAARSEGQNGVFLLDRPQVEAGFFAAPGPYAILTRDPRFELRDLAPGPARLHAWHPRLPPVTRAVDVQADQVTRVDLEMGVGRGSQETSDATH
ncbi:MAG TPA: hypothetical protein VMR50_18600 [Myxococcota bacterium]|nr:hypothetical protein [Myxococcota bacterium]